MYQRNLKDLEKDILDLLFKAKGNKLRRYKIRDKLYQHKYGKKYDAEDSFNVILQRFLNSLRDLGCLERDNAGHQEVYYGLTKEGLKIAKREDLEHKILSTSKKLDEKERKTWIDIALSLTSLKRGWQTSTSLEDVNVFDGFFRVLEAQVLMEEYPKCLIFNLDRKVDVISERAGVILSYLLIDLVENQKYSDEVVDKDFNLQFRFNGNEVRKYLQAKEKKYLQAKEKEKQETPVTISLEKIMEEEFEKLNL